MRSWAEIPGGLSARPEKSPEFRTGPKIPWAEIHGTRKSEFQQFCHKSRMALIEIADDSDIDDDERERFSFTLSAKNADAFINGIGGQHLFDRLFSLHGLDLISSLQILIELNVRYSFMYLSYLFISSAQVLNLYDEYFCTWFDEDDLMISLIIYGSRKSDILLGQTTKEYNELYTRLIERKFKLIAKTHTYASC
ncbi:unnamed protein product [Rotaria sp. Silwood1]|nr:unnamed protein product [Rotaria sp. Silwood1]